MDNTTSATTPASATADGWELEINESHPSIIRLNAETDGLDIIRLVIDISEVRHYLSAGCLMEDDLYIEVIGKYYPGSHGELEYIDVDFMFLLEDDDDMEITDITDWYYRSAWQVRAHIEGQVLNEVHARQDLTRELYTFFEGDTDY